MDKELKIALILLLTLLILSAILLNLLANIYIFSREFFLGFLPFALLLTPYILFSSKFFSALWKNWVSNSLWKKILFPFYILFLYSIFSLFSETFQWGLLFRLSLWLLIPTLVFSHLSANHSNISNQSEPLSLQTILVILLLWLPVEFGKLSGFDIIFNKEIQIPALAFVAPAFGLYLFTVLKNLTDIGFTFRFQLKDILKAVVALSLLALILIPFGTQTGFIEFSVLRPSFEESLKLIFGIYFLVALPEELLFRGIIQNLLTKTFSNRFHSMAPSLLISSIIFGLSHWNNLSPPDWRYIFLATIAGIFYGLTYIQTGKTTVSALVHCGINFLWAVLFAGSAG